MAEQQKLDATFFAFKKREPRHVLTRAAVAYLAIYLLLAAVYLAATWTSLSALLSWYFGMAGSLAQGGAFTGPPPEALAMLPAGGLLALACLVLFAALEAACLRWLVRGESGSGVLGLTAGADTWRVLATYLVWLGLFIGFCIVVAVFYALCGVLADVGGAAQIVALLLGALAPLGFLALLIWGAVRYAPAAAMSIARGRFAFFEAPRATRGRFWELLGSFLILWVIYFVAATIVGQIIQIPLMQQMAPMMRDMMSGDVSRIGEHMQTLMTSPTYIAVMAVYSVVSAILALVFYIAMFGVNARAVLAADEAGAAPS
jgi:hypothetical protein